MDTVVILSMSTGTPANEPAGSVPDTTVETTADPPTEATSNTSLGPTSSTPLEPGANPLLEPASETPTLTELPSNTSLEPASGGPKRKQLTRDQRLQIHTLRKAGHSYDFIVNFFKPDKVTFRQVAYAATQPIEPQNHRCGAKPKLDAETRRQVKNLMEKSAGPRPITYKEVSTQLGLGVSQSTLRRARMAHYHLVPIVLIAVGYEDDASSTKPYQYDKKKAIKAPPGKKAPKQLEAEQNARVVAPSVEVSRNDPSSPATVPTDLATSWTTSLQNYMSDNEPQPA
ncbi:MAG: hypothetical protein LQ348_000606 [Seirophora lacunosa]|nr:MAG: hypothetical protein LQ348_000606 [Seirophora lacunosa]